MTEQQQNIIDIMASSSSVEEWNANRESIMVASGIKVYNNNRRKRGEINVAAPLFRFFTINVDGRGLINKVVKK